MNYNRLNYLIKKIETENEENKKKLQILINIEKHIDENLEILCEKISDPIIFENKEIQKLTREDNFYTYFLDNSKNL